MTAIAAAGAVTSSVLPVETAASAVAAATAASPATTPAAPQPAVTISISANAASAATTASSAPTVQPLTINATLDQVSRTLDLASQVQVLSFEYKHANWNGFHQKWGEQATKNLQAGFISELNSSNTTATEMGSRFGIPIQSNLTLPTETDGSVSGSPTISGGITVTPFNFSSGGSTYAVTTNTAGQLVGTKDGQAWRTWGIPANDIRSTTDELVALLASFKVKDAAENRPTEAPSTGNEKVNISA